jgi:hypothetical protein
MGSVSQPIEQARSTGQMTPESEQAIEKIVNIAADQCLEIAAHTPFGDPAPVLEQTRQLFTENLVGGKVKKQFRNRWSIAAYFVAIYNHILQKMFRGMRVVEADRPKPSRKDGKPTCLAAELPGREPPPGEPPIDPGADQEEGARLRAAILHDMADLREIVEEQLVALGSTSLRDVQIIDLWLGSEGRETLTCREIAGQVGESSVGQVCDVIQRFTRLRVIDDQVAGMQERYSDRRLHFFCEQMAETATRRVARLFSPLDDLCREREEDALLADLRRFCERLEQELDAKRAKSEIAYRYIDLWLGAEDRLGLSYRGIGESFGQPESWARIYHQISAFRKTASLAAEVRRIQERYSRTLKPLCDRGDDSAVLRVRRLFSPDAYVQESH